MHAASAKALRMKRCSNANTQWEFWDWDASSYEPNVNIERKQQEERLEFSLKKQLSSQTLLSCFSEGSSCSSLFVGTQDLQQAMCECTPSCSHKHDPLSLRDKLPFDFVRPLGDKRRRRRAVASGDRASASTKPVDKPIASSARQECRELLSSRLDSSVLFVRGRDTEKNRKLMPDNVTPPRVMVRRRSNGPIELPYESGARAA